MSKAKKKRGRPNRSSPGLWHAMPTGMEAKDLADWHRQIMKDLHRATVSNVRAVMQGMAIANITPIIIMMHVRYSRFCVIFEFRSKS